MPSEPERFAADGKAEKAPLAGEEL